MEANTNNFVSSAHLMHDIINHVSTIMSISQFALISKEMSPELQLDIKRIVSTSRTLSIDLKHLARMLEEED